MATKARCSVFSEESDEPSIGPGTRGAIWGLPEESPDTEVCTSVLQFWGFDPNTFRAQSLLHARQVERPEARSAECLSGSGCGARMGGHYLPHPPFMPSSQEQALPFPELGGRAQNVPQRYQLVSRHRGVAMDFLTISIPQLFQKSPPQDKLMQAYTLQDLNLAVDCKRQKVEKRLGTRH